MEELSRGRGRNADRTAPVPGTGSAGDAGLASLFAPLRDLPGVGPILNRRLARLLGREEPRLVDLLFHLPRGCREVVRAERLRPEFEGATVALEVEIRDHRPAMGRLPYRIRARAAGGMVDLVFFQVRRSWLETRFAPGTRLLVRGRLQIFRGRFQIPHPEVLAGPGETGAERLILYPTTAELPRERVARLARVALERLPELPEWHEPDALRPVHGLSFRDALSRLHRGEEDPAAAATPARLRLALDELFAMQLALLLARRRSEREPGRAIRGDGRLVNALLRSLPFRPTAAQWRALEEIRGDLAAPHPMMRLLQGDVGSGKTLVAVLAMLTAVEAGCQAVLMAPTEILARQHHATLQSWLEPLGIEVGLLTGREPRRRRDALLVRLGQGRLPLCVGTHALLQEEVAFSDLALAVIDEQHRFGVAQRLALVAKGSRVDLLLMSATPIPRTLLLCWYGDIASSRLDQKPPGRRPVDTRLISLARIEEVVAALARALASGARGYWICPAVAPAEETDIAAAEARFAALRERLGERVGLVHGAMAKQDQRRAMEAFARGELQLLVATTVVEVGVDVPEASLIVVEQAERFGLAQLHQLRGRVGRGARPGTCLLLYAPPLSAGARARLRLLRTTDDGFRLAEEDLRLRGPGEVLGARQSGFPEFRFARLPEHEPLLRLAATRARSAVTRLEALPAARREALSLLLALFGHEAAGELLRAG